MLCLNKKLTLMNTERHLDANGKDETKSCQRVDANFSEHLRERAGRSSDQLMRPRDPRATDSAARWATLLYLLTQIASHNVTFPSFLVFFFFPQTSSLIRFLACCCCADVN